MVLPDLVVHQVVLQVFLQAGVEVERVGVHIIVHLYHGHGLFVDGGGKLKIRTIFYSQGVG